MTLANQGLFSPRLLRFLGVNFEQIQTEEEGCIISLLDTQLKIQDTAWHMVDEEWLLKWRKFVRGRGARRYLPPGKITNQRLVDLLAEGERVDKKNLHIARDYRCVNFNVWRFSELVHGGEPVIARAEQDIYSPVACSHLHAIIMVQTRIRMYMAMKTRDFLCMKKLSSGQVALDVMRDICARDVRERAERLIHENHRERVNANLHRAIDFTQRLWRLKKQYALEENLEDKRKDQELFAKTKGIAKDVPQSIDAGRIITDVHDIVHIGGTNVHVKVLKDCHAALPFSVAKRPGTETAEVAASAKNTQDDSFIPGSTILSLVNGLPTNMLRYEEVKTLLADADYPITLRLQRPTDDKLVQDLDKILTMPDAVVQFNAFKIYLQQGLALAKHNNRNMKCRLTTLKITEKDAYYTGRQDLRTTEDKLWNSSRYSVCASSWTDRRAQRLNASVLRGRNSNAVCQ